MLTIKLDNKIIDQRISRKKTKKLIRRKSIAIEMDQKIIQNVANLEAMSY